MTQGKKLLINSMIIKELDLKLFTNQNKMKLKEQGFKILTPKQMLQRLLIPAAQKKQAIIQKVY